MFDDRCGAPIRGFPNRNHTAVKITIHLNKTAYKMKEIGLDQGVENYPAIVNSQDNRDFLNGKLEELSPCPHPNYTQSFASIVPAAKMSITKPKYKVKNWFENISKGYSRQLAT